MNTETVQYGDVLTFAFPNTIAIINVGSEGFCKPWICLIKFMF